MVAHVAKPDPGRAGANKRGIGGSVSAAVNSIEAGTRDVKAFSSPMVEECETHDGRGLAKQAQRVNPPPLVGVVSPGKLDQPAKLVRDAVDEVLDFGCGGRRLNAEQLIESRTLVAIAEPGFDDTVDRERNRHGHKEHEQVLPEKAAKTLPDHHARAPQSNSDRTDLNSVAGAARGVHLSAASPYRSVTLRSGICQVLLSIHFETGRSPGLEVPAALLAPADEVVEWALLHRIGPEVAARLRHADGHQQCLFIGGDRKSSVEGQNGAFDPEQTNELANTAIGCRTNRYLPFWHTCQP